jgi:hypothetical protein
VKEQNNRIVQQTKIKIFYLTRMQANPPFVKVERAKKKTALKRGKGGRMQQLKALWKARHKC